MLQLTLLYKEHKEYCTVWLSFLGKKRATFFPSKWQRSRICEKQPSPTHSLRYGLSYILYLGFYRVFGKTWKLRKEPNSLIQLIGATVENTSGKVSIFQKRFGLRKIIHVLPVRIFYPPTKRILFSIFFSGFRKTGPSERQ